MVFIKIILSFMNIFVANLNYRVRRDDLKGIFAEYGEVASARVITNRETGRSKGFGFVEMPNEAEGLKAIQELNGAEWEGKTIIVKVSEPRESNGSPASYSTRSEEN
jgi:RNA recognition motif-containing protein